MAELVRDTSSTAGAEIALVVADAYQRQGIGSALCAYLLAAARRHGVAALHATALAENTAVRRMVAQSAAPYSAETRQGMTTIQIDLRNSVTSMVRTIRGGELRGTLSLALPMLPRAS